MIHNRAADEEVLEAMHAPDMGPFFVRTAAVSVENTHNFAGGAVLPVEDPLAQGLRLGLGLQPARFVKALSDGDVMRAAPLRHGGTSAGRTAAGAPSSRWPR